MHLGWFLCLWAVAVVAVACAAAPRCPGRANPYPVYTASPRLWSTVTNGKLYVAGNGSDFFYIQHLYGTPYEMGLAHGTLFKEIIPTGLNRFYDWVEGQIEEILPWLPAYVAGLVADFGVPIALEWTWNNTKPFTHQRYIDEMNGIADGIPVNRQHIYNINMIAELIKAQCSIIGARGEATRHSLNGGVVHLRTLDGMGGSTMPIKDYPVVTVYHPSGAPTVANFGWVSFIGSVTGMGEFVGVGEKYWGSHNQSVMKTAGEAWTFVTRDLLSAPDFTSAISLLNHANRTCAIHLGISSSKNDFIGAEVVGEEVIYFNDTSINYPQHPIFKGMVYWDKHSQPTPSYCFPDLFQQQYGHITAESLATVVAPMAETGSLHSVVWDYVTMQAYFANARKTNATDGDVKSFTRQFTRLNMSALFAETL